MGNVSILIVAETKIHAASPKMQFSDKGHQKLHHLDEPVKSGGILVYINFSMNSRQLHCCNLNLST